MNKVWWGKAKINHYIIKSNWEFANKKIPIGTVAWGNNIHRNWLFFQSHDVNEVFEPIPLYLQQQRDKQMAQLKEELRKVGYTYPERKASKHSKSEDILKEIESIEIIENELVFKGWIMDANGRAATTELELFLTSSNKEKVIPSSFKIVKSRKAKEIKFSFLNKMWV